MSDVKYQVFISSTFTDLQEERRTVIEQILNLRHIPVGMELFQANDDNQWEYIKRRINECDYYVVIIAERYGSETKGRSYTQLEYEYARKMKIPVMAFLLDSNERGRWPSDKTEFEKKIKVDNFRKICEKKLVRYWKNSDDLGAKFATTLVEMTSTNPRIGWVRADSMASQLALNEIAALSEEKRELQKIVENFERSQSQFMTPPNIRHRIEALKKSHISGFVDVSPPNSDISMEDTNLLEALIYISQGLSLGMNTYYANAEMNKFVLKGHGVRVDFSPFFSELSTNGIIVIETYQNHGFQGNVSTHRNYVLTDLGKELIIHARRDREE